MRLSRLDGLEKRLYMLLDRGDGLLASRTAIAERVMRQSLTRHEGQHQRVRARGAARPHASRLPCVGSPIRVTRLAQAWG
jgi:hypothetical protein